MVKSAKSALTGIGVVVEKEFEGGRALMHQAGYMDIPIEALVTIINMDNDSIVMKGD